MIGLFLTADLDNVTDLSFVDPPEDPFLYTFKVRCTSCKETHPNPITVNRYEEPEGNTDGSAGPRADANFMMRCKNCKKESRISLKFDSSVARAYPLDMSGSKVLMLKIDTRGLDILAFVPDGKFKCVAGTLDDEGSVQVGPTVFDPIDLEENEWYDYDDNLGNEVSITNAQWTFEKVK